MLHTHPPAPLTGDYEAAISCLGPQTQSKTGNSIPVRFGTSTRDVNICQKGFEVPFYGKDSPGPKYGAGHGAFGDQPYAHRRNAARISFTKVRRCCRMLATPQGQVEGCWGRLECKWASSHAHICCCAFLAELWTSRNDISRVTPER